MLIAELGIHETGDWVILVKKDEFLQIKKSLYI